MPYVKICGIQQVQDGLVAAEAGANFIGLVFVPARRRRVELAAAANIVATLTDSFPHPPKIIGLFADQPLAETLQTIKTCRLDGVQLCGQESPDYCRQVMQESGAGVIKVAHIPGTDTAGGEYGEVEERLAPYQKTGCRITLDRLVEGLPGGTGRSFDWRVAAQLSQKGHCFFLAGGLTPDNVAHAVAQANPWGVDVSSGVEINGAKDPEKIRAFIEQALRRGG